MLHIRIAKMLWLLLRMKIKNTYVAYDNYIKVIKGDGREETLLQDKSLKIENVVFYKNTSIFYF